MISLLFIAFSSDLTLDLMTLKYSRSLLQCTGSEPKGSLEILSLAYANAELVFALIGSLFVAILYKTKKAEDPDFLQEDELLNKLATLEKANATFETRLKRLESA